MGKGPQQTFSQRRRMNGQQAYTKVFNITQHKGNANENHIEISPYPCLDGFYLKRKTTRENKCR